MNQEFEYMKNLRTTELVEIIENIWGVEETGAAMLELYARNKNKVLEMGLEILKEDKGNDYFQSTVFDIIYDINPRKVLETLEKRKCSFNAILLGDVMSEISIDCYRKQMPEFSTELIDTILEQYDSLDLNQKDIIIETYSEFIETIDGKLNYKRRNTLKCC